MTTRQILLTAFAPLALLAVGVTAMRTASAIAEARGNESVTELLRMALDRPEKLSPDHVQTVLASAAAIETADRRAQDSALRTFHSFGSTCLKLGVLGIVTTALAVVAGKRRGDVPTE